MQSYLFLIFSFKIRVQMQVAMQINIGLPPRYLINLSLGYFIVFRQLHLG